MTDDDVFVCPECASDEVIVRAVTSYKVNGGEFYCHSVKPHDSNAKAVCLACNWEGERHQLIDEWEGK